MGAVATSPSALPLPLPLTMASLLPLLLGVWLASLALVQANYIPLTGRAGSSLPDSCSSDICQCGNSDDGWFLPYPCNCHWYYQCNKVGNDWSPKMFDCGTWVFDPHQEACIWPELAPPEMCDLPDDCTAKTTTPMTCPLPCQTVGGDLTVRDTTLCVTNRGSKVPTTVSIVTTWTPTKKLDHPTVRDYSAGHTAVFESGPDVDYMSQCNNAE